MTQQAMQDLKDLFRERPSTDELTQRLNALNAEIQELKQPLRMRATAHHAVQQELTRLDTRRKYLPNDRKLRKERKLVAEKAANAELDYESTREHYRQAKLEYENLLTQRRLLELEDEARDSPFIIPDADPLIATVIAAAICESLQYQYVSSSRYYHWLIDKCNRGDAGETGHGDTNNSAGIPEIEQQWIDKLDEMRQKREYLTMLRISAEAAFKQHFAELPENAPFTPKMLRRSDEELEAQLEARSATKWREKRDRQNQVADAEHSLARKEDKTYVPKI